MGSQADPDGVLAITATGTDSNSAASTAGSGGIVAGDCAHAWTADDSTTAADIGDSCKIYASQVTVSADNSSTFTPDVNSVSASAVGGSGAEAWTNDAASATAALDDNTTITASGTVSVTAHNAFTESTSAPSVQSGAGGVISGNAAQNHTTLDEVANTFDDTTNDVSAGVFLGNSVSITSGTDPFQSPGRVLLNAYSTLDAVDNVTIQAYGVFAGGGAASKSMPPSTTTW